MMNAFMAGTGWMFWISMVVGLAFAAVREPSEVFEVNGYVYECYDHVGNGDVVSCDKKEKQ